MVRHGRAIRVRTSTTHPAMAQLIRQLFLPHGAIHEYPKKAQFVEYEWCLDCDVDGSFEFLLNPKDSMKAIFSSQQLFLTFLAGFFDAEGSIYYHKKRSSGGFELSMNNVNEGLLGEIASKLSEMGLSPKLRRASQNPERGVKNGGEFIGRLTLWRYENIAHILKILPIRHAEKCAKAAIALTLGYRSGPKDRRDTIARWDALKLQIRSQRDDYVDKARLEYLARRKHSAMPAEEAVTSSATQANDEEYGHR